MGTDYGTTTVSLSTTNYLAQRTYPRITVPHEDTGSESKEYDGGDKVRGFTICASVGGSIGYYPKTLPVSSARSKPQQVGYAAVI